jgi:hypothetical protein
MPNKEITIPPQPLPKSSQLTGINLPAIPTPRKAFIVGRTLGVNFLKAKIIAANIEEPLTVGGDTKTYSISPGRQNESIGISQLGTIKFGQFIVKTKETVAITDERTFYQNGDGYFIVETAIGSVTQSRNIVKTPIQGRNGTVKEYVSDGDFEISIVGKIVDTGNKYPDDQLNDIVNILKVQNEIVIINNFIKQFGIDNVVIESYSFSQVEGSNNQYEMNISLVSDDPIELKLGIADA